MSWLLSKTPFILIKCQLTGDMSTQKCRYERLELEEPSEGDDKAKIDR